MSHPEQRMAREQFLAGEAVAVRRFIDSYTMQDFMARDLPSYSREYTHGTCGFRTPQATEIWDHLEGCPL